MYTVPSAVAARTAVDAGVDIIVAQGWEAGGHVKGEVATMALVPRVVDAVPSTPVVAASRARKKSSDIPLTGDRSGVICL